MTLDMAYNSEEGVIITKSDVGTLNYDFSAKPYELSSVVSSAGVIPAVLDSLTYTSFGSVSTISEGISSATFNYNAFDERSKMEIKQSCSTILTRWYSTDSYIKETSGSVTKEYTFIGGSVYSAPAVAITQSGTTTYYYLLRDHLGSITHVVNASTNTVAYEYSYDAWGRLRNPSTWAYYAAGSEPALFIAGRGYTGHEHLPWFSLINMNGRLYDATVGQFLSPDNYNQDAGSTQNFNRFAYCRNNPLKFKDTNGMAMVPIKTTDDNGYPINPEFQAWWNNYYSEQESQIVESEQGGGGGGYRFDISTGNYYDSQNNYASWSEVYYNYVLQNSSPVKLDHQIIPLGPGMPYLDKLTFDWRPSNNKYVGDFEVIVRVYGNQYSDYNFIQSINNPGSQDWSIDNPHGEGHGFYYDTFWKNVYSAPFYRKGANAYFEDGPRAEGSKWQLTICGNNNGIWSAIGTFTWSYSVTDGKMKGFFNQTEPSDGHQTNINNTLFYWNNH